MQKTKIFSLGLVVILVLMFIPAMVVAQPPDPYSNPDQIGTYGNIQPGDLMKYKFTVSDSLSNWWDAQNTQDIVFLVLTYVTSGNVSEATLLRSNINHFLDSLDTVRIAAYVNKVVQPNDTWVGEVSGTWSIEDLDYQALYDLLIGFHFINQTEVSYPDFRGNVSEAITEIPGNFTLLTILNDLLSSGLGSSIPMPIMLSNNWTWWGEGFDFIETMLPGLIFTEHGLTTHSATNLDAFYTKIDLNMSFLIFELLNDTLYPVFSDPNDYYDWVRNWGNITVETYAHEESAVLLEGTVSMNLTAILDNMQQVFEEINATSPDPLLEIIINVLADLPRPNMVSISMVMSEFKYAGVYLVGGPPLIPPFDIGLLTLTVVVIIVVIAAVGGGGAIYYFGYHKPRASRLRIKF